MSKRPLVEPEAALKALIRLTQQRQRERHTGEAMQALLRLRKGGRESRARANPPEPQT